MEQIKVNIARCKGCFLCVSVCPSGALKPSDLLGEKGYNVVAVDANLCVKCGACYRMCPDYVLSIEN